MQKVLSVILVILTIASLCLAICSCVGKNGTESTFDAESELRSKVSADTAVYCKLNYGDVKNVLTSITNISSDGNIYTVQGKAKIIDNYGDTYEGKLTATYKLNDKSFIKQSYKLDTPTKTN